MDRYGEMDAGDGDSDPEADPEQLLNEWLGELDTLTGGLDSVSSTGALRPLCTSAEITAPRIDSYRFSMANLEDSQDVDLDAILGELCALETQCDQEIGRAQQSKRSSQASDQQKLSQHHSRTHSRSSSEGGNRISNESSIGEVTIKNDGQARTDSPDNDSAFSDTVSMLSSESSASSGASGSKPHGLTLQLGSQDAASKAKAEKIRMALEKMKEASVKKLFIKAFTMDGSTKSLLVDEKMVCGYVIQLLADKNHVQMDPKWAIVEHLPDLYMERVYEDHELLVENLMLWTRDSKNKLLFVERPDKTQLFVQPEHFLLSQTDKCSKETDYDDHARNMLLEEFFGSNTTSIPEIEGPLYLKSDSKKGWKKYNFVLRASGLYYWPKEKAKSSRDLVCLATLDVNQVYYGIGWRKKYKAPTDYCFAIKHPRLQQPKSTKYIKFLCAEDSATLERWMVGMRIVKHGRQLMDNYRSLIDDLTQDDLDALAHARSCSVSSIAMPNSQSTLLTPTQGIYGAGNETSGRHSRASSSSSSGCMSDGAPSSCENAFDSEFSMGTIKRKPSVKPSLPLTSITRQLKEVGETRDMENDPSQANCPSPNLLNGSYTNTGTLTRHHSRRKSNSTDDSSNSGTLKRQHLKARGSLESMGGHSGNSTPVGTPVREQGSPFTERIPSGTNSPIPTPTTVSSPVSIGGISMTDSVTSLPPPPEASSFDPELDDPESYPLPPPPLDQFRSTLSLDSLPPPPAPSELPTYSNSDISGSQLSLMSLPPPPDSQNNNDTIRRRTKAPTPTNMLDPDRTPTGPLSPDSTPTQSRLNTPCFSPPPLSIGSNCSTPTHINPPTCFSPTPLNQSNTMYGSTNGQPIYGTTSQQSPQSPIHQQQPPAYVSPPPYSRQSSTLPNERFSPSPNAQGLRSSLRQQSLPRQVSVNSIVSTNSSSSSGSTIYAVPPYLAELQAKNSPQTQRKVNFQEPLPASPKKSTKKISFNLIPQEVPPLPKKPPPPKRSEKTKLSSPKKLAESNSAPPIEFLKDLQRVMKKKWQVAQKCKLEPATTPHEVLGFRDPPSPVADYRETNVSNWVQEHYGADNVYENVYTANPDAVVNYATSPVHLKNSNQRDSIRSKRPPPPPPKRSETTHLTTSKLH